MNEDVRYLYFWFRLGTAGVAIAALLLGALSLLAPPQSIGLYQWIMERFNWRVTPIDEVRELRNTRVLGALLVVLGAVLLWRLFVQHA